jgi:hypothetical protein
VLRKQFAALKPAHVPEAPTHAGLLAAAEATRGDERRDRHEQHHTTAEVAR